MIMQILRRGGAITIIGFVSLMLGITQISTAGTWATLDAPVADRTYIRGIDGSNIVGSYVDGSGSHGFIYNGTTWTVLPGMPRGIDGTKIVGSYGSSAYIYDTTDSTWNTFDGPGAIRTQALGIDGDNIVGAYETGDYEPTFSDKHGFIYDGSTLTTLEAPGASGATRAYDIDGSNIVGESANHGFLYDGTIWTQLDMPGAMGTTASGIEGNRIVGNYQYEQIHWGSFLYDGTTWTTLLKPGAFSTFAEEVSGDNIVGSYSDDSGNMHGFIYTIPEPATLLLYALGGLVLRRNRN